MNNQNNLGQEIYDGSASFGIFMSKISLVVGCIIGICLIITGLTFLFNKNDYSKVTGIVKSVDCEPTFDVTNSPNTKYKCNISAEINLHGQDEYTSLVSTKVYKVGESIILYFDPNSEGVTFDIMPDKKTQGFIFLFIGIVLILGVIFNYYIVNRYKFAASASGVSRAVHMI